jgi:Sulfotransferase domain
MSLPSFLIIGAQKSGTSWLARNLGQHPQVFMPSQEIHFFDKDYNFNKGVDWYEGHFKDAAAAVAIGEKTPDYLWADGQGVEGHLPDVHKNIYKTLPEAKLIVILRNPVERAIAAVNHIVRTGRISPLHHIDDLLTGNKRHLMEGHGVIDYGRYYRQIKAYHHYFQPDRMLILIYEEDVVQNPGRAMGKVCEFLGLDPSYQFGSLKRKVNAEAYSFPGMIIRYYLPPLKPLAYVANRILPNTKYYPSEPVLDQLYDLYADDNEKLYALLGRRISSWQRETASSRHEKYGSSSRMTSEQ